MEGEGTENNPFVINSIEDLVAFADSVTKGNTYEGQYVKLSQSLDFKSDKSYNIEVLENNFNAANIKLLNTCGSSEVMENCCAGITGQTQMETSVIRNCYNNSRTKYRKCRNR